MSVSKTTTGLILFAKNEGTYGAGATLTGSTDTVSLFREFPVFAYEWAYDGVRDGASYTGGTLTRVAPSGRTTNGTVRVEGKGLGSAYGASAFPPSLHQFLLASNLSGSLSGSAWVYQPASLATNPYSSLAMAVYDRGEMLPVSGGLATFVMSAESAAPTMFEFTIQGLAGDITDVSTPPARTYIAKDVVPPKNESIGLTIGSVTDIKVRSYSLDLGQEITPRVDLNTSTGHAGFAFGRRTPVFNVTIEATALSTYNPYSDQTLSTSRAITMLVGTGSNNRIKLDLPQTQLMSVEKAEDGPVALWNLQFAVNVSAPDLNDDIRLSFLP